MSSKPTLQVLAKMEQLPVLPLTYSQANSDASATKLIYSLLPEWNPANGGRGISIVKFTDGITNTVCISQFFFLFFPLCSCLLFLFLLLPVPCITIDWIGRGESARLAMLQTCEKVFSASSMTTGRNGTRSGNRDFGPFDFNLFFFG